MKEAKKALSQRTMLVNLSISMWSGRKRDKEVSDEVTTLKNSEHDCGDWWTHLVPRKTIAKIANAGSFCRTLHAQLTLPWMDGGLRILPAEMFLEYSERMRTAIEKHDKAVDEFLTEYPTIQRDAKKRLGKLGEHACLPSIEEIKHRFGVVIDLLPMPDTNDFRLDIVEEQMEEIKQRMTSSVTQMTVKAVTDLWGRLDKMVDKLHSKLQDPDKILRDSLITNLTEFCTNLPKLNITDDEKLEEMRKEILDKLTSLSTEELREDDQQRTKAAKTAKDVLEKMRTYYNK